MKFGNMLSNPSLGGKVLLGGAGMDFFKKNGQWDTRKVIVTVVVIAVVLGLVLFLTGYLAFGKENMTGTTQFGVGPTASHIPGYGTYGYAQALTYNLQREPNELAEHQVVQAQRRADRKYQNKQSEGMADMLLLDEMANMDNNSLLMLKEQMVGVDPLVEEMVDMELENRGFTTQDIQDALGTLDNPFENMSDLCDSVIDDSGVHGLLRRATRVGYDVQSGEAARAVNQLYKGCIIPQENMKDLSPAVTIERPVLPGFNIGGISAGPEAFSEMKIPRRSEHMSNPRVMEENATEMRKGNFVVTQVSSPNIGEIGSGQIGYQDPTQVDLAGIPASLNTKTHYHAHSTVAEGISPNVESFGLMPNYKKKGYNSRGYGGTGPYSGDQVKFLTLSKDNQGAKVVESDCDQYGRCKISFVEQPGKFTDLVDVIYELNRTEREELMNLGRRFTRYQLNARDRLRELSAKKALAQTDSSVQFTELDQQEIATLQEFLQINGADVDRYNELVKKSLVKLSEKQYIVARNVPYNACQVPKGMRRYGKGGQLVNLNKFLPANACDYLDYDREFNKTTLVGNISKDDMVKMSDSIRSTVGQ